MFWLCIFFYSKFKDNQLIFTKRSKLVIIEKTQTGVLSNMGNSVSYINVGSYVTHLDLPARLGSKWFYCFHKSHLPSNDKNISEIQKNVIGLWKNFQESSKIFWAEAAARESVLSSHCWAGRNPHLREWVPVASWVSMFYSHLIPVYLKNHLWLENGQQSNSEGGSEEGPLNISLWMCLWDKVTQWHLQGQHPLGNDVWLCTLEEAISLYSCSLGTLWCNVYFSSSF